ncbi:MAG: CoA transferase [Rhodospirillales bacterium]
MDEKQKTDQDNSPEPGTSKARLLEGVRVLDLTRFLSGPQATLFLSAMGAEVVRIDDPRRGDPTAGAPPFLGTDGPSMSRQSAEDVGIAYLKRGRGKKSLGIDLRTDDGRALLLKLVAKADVLVENFRVGVTKKMGIDYASLKQINPGLVYCSITGYGATGPERHRKAYDLMVQAASGLMSITGEPGSPPQKAGSPLSDGIAGTFAVSGILAALLQRQRTGEGQFIDVSMADCLVALVSDEPWDCYEALGLPYQQGNRIMRFSPFNTYTAADGQVALGAATQKDWIALLDLMGRDDLKSDTGFMDTGWRILNNDTVDRVVADWTANLTVADIVTRCDAADIPSSPIRHVRDLREWEHQSERRMLQPLPLPDGSHDNRVAAPAFPLRFSNADTTYPSPAATTGQHTDDVLSRWLDLDTEETGKLRQKGTI